MVRYLLSRLAWAGPVVIAIVIATFLIIHLVPGDPIQALVGDFPTPPGYAEQVRKDFGLDQPLATQLWRYLVNLSQGNLGFSFSNRQPVLNLVLDRAQYTLLIMIPALTVAALLGVIMALAAAPRAGGLFDSGITALSVAGFSIPVFWLGQILMLVFAIQLSWLPAQGMVSARASLTGLAWTRDVIWHMVLPIFSITSFYVAIVARVARASVLEALSQDFVLTARAKGLSRRTVLWRHVLPNAMIPVVTVIGYNFGHSLTGAILVETVFAWPGLGNLFITSIGNRDYPVLLGIFLITAIAVVIANLMTDIVYAVLDPRVRSSYGRHV
jgi:ABC-type dipeptide/oligopeptide/nickel transport system permease component